MSIKEPLWKPKKKPEEKNCAYKSQSCQALVCRRDDWPQHPPVILYYFWFLHTSIELFAETHLSHSGGWTPSYHRGCCWKCDNILFLEKRSSRFIFEPVHQESAVLDTKSPLKCSTRSKSSQGSAYVIKSDVKFDQTVYLI